MEAKILIIDDQRAVRNLLVRYLGDSGYDCHTGMEIAELTKYAIREGLTSL
jgi:DNA-binding NtrC family response regulator